MYKGLLREVRGENPYMQEWTSCSHTYSPSRHKAAVRDTRRQLPDERNHPLPALRVLVSVLLLVNSVLLGGPFSHLSSRYSREEYHYNDIAINLSSGDDIRTSVLTSGVTSHDTDCDPGTRLEQVVGAGDQVEAVALGELSRLTGRRSDVSQVEMGEQV